MREMQILSYNFDGPYDPDRRFIESFCAVYTIIDTRTKIIDVGETGDINGRFPNHDRKPCWMANGTGILELYIYKESSEEKRRQIESEIRNVYNPPCGEI